MEIQIKDGNFDLKENLVSQSRSLNYRISFPETFLRRSMYFCHEEVMSCGTSRKVKVQNQVFFDFEVSIFNLYFH